MMGNDPRPDYFHQTNMMSQTGPRDRGRRWPLLHGHERAAPAQYNQYFKANAPIEQLTMADIATLLSEQSKWLAVNRTQVTGSIEGSAVTLNNSGSALELPLTGMTTVGSDYAGSHSGWTLAPAGTSTYTALTAWPAPPTVPVIVTVPTGPAPTLGSGQTTPKPQPGSPPAPKGASKPPAAPIVYFAVQAAPKTVKVSHGKVTVSLNCKASKGRTVKGKTCAGTFTLTVAGHKVSHSFRFKSGKVSRITVKLPKRSMSAVTAAAHHKPKARKTAGKLVITTKLTRQVLSQRQGDAHDQGLTRTMAGALARQSAPATRLQGEHDVAKSPHHPLHRTPSRALDPADRCLSCGGVGLDRRILGDSPRNSCRWDARTGDHPVRTCGSRHVP